jgi:hypothetical protein
VLDTPRQLRQKSVEEELGPFPYLNGRLFEERLAIPEFNGEMRKLLLNCCHVQ